MQEQGVLTLKSKKILIIGTGAWGTALGCVLFDNKHEVKMYGTNQIQVNDLKEGRNNTYFRNVNINFKPSLVSTNFDDFKEDIDYIIFAIPTSAYSTFIEKYKNKINKNAILIIASKGLEPNSGLTLNAFMKQKCSNKICSLLGPGFAKEVINRKKTFVNIISNDLDVADNVANLFSNKNFLAKAISDVDGSTALASFKNALAILFGLLEYQKISINTKSAILTLAIQEIISFIKENGGNIETVNELCGIGDIFLTCTDRLSRNFQFGYDIGEIGINDLIKRTDVTVEGYKFINSFFKIKKNKKDKYIIFYTIYLLVNDKIQPKKVVDHIWELYHEK